MEDVFSAPYSNDQVYVYNWVIPVLIETST